MDGSEKKDKARERARAWRLANPERFLESVRRCKEANPQKYKELQRNHYLRNIEARKEQSKKWRTDNPERNTQLTKAWVEKNPQRRREIANNWRKNNPEKVNAIYAHRRAAKLRAVPSWANHFFIQEIYDLARRRTKATGIKWHVDHIVPLQSNLVCGLHVEHNLQVIPSRDNQKKNNI